MRTLLIAALVAGSAATALAAPAPAPETTNTVGMSFALIQPGSMQVGVFTPGCPSPPAALTPPAAGASSPPPRDPRLDWSKADYEACARIAKAEARPGFKVDVAKPFYMGRFEVTQGQWTRVMGKNPSTFKGGPGQDFSDHPVDSITWADAQAFVAALNRLERTNAYRLPTEFEWEYACRAGGAGQQSWADIRAHAVEVGQSLGFGQGRTPRSSDLPPPTPEKVGSKPANAFGLHDMLGNVWEWTADRYNNKTFPDPTPPRSGDVRVLKGGGFVADVKNVICATHAGGPGDGWDVGLRIAKDVR